MRSHGGTADQLAIRRTDGWNDRTYRWAAGVLTIRERGVIVARISVPRARVRGFLSGMPRLVREAVR